MKIIDFAFMNYLDKANKCYKKYVNKEFKKKLIITFDQWLILKNIYENCTITQKELAKNILKDVASVNRIIKSLIKLKYINYDSVILKRKKKDLTVTNEGLKIMNEASIIIENSTKKALMNIETSQGVGTSNILKTFISNCQQ